MKKLCALLLLVSLLAGLCGCHQGTKMETFSPPESFDASRNYTITFWAKNDSNEHQVAIYRQAISDFEALYPNIHVELKTYTNYGDIYKDVITNISTGTTPNVCITYPDHIATYTDGSNNMVVPLDKLFTHPEYGLGSSKLKFDGPAREEIVPEFLEECKIGGTYFALPYMRSTEACYINKTYVEKLGYTVPDVLTWDFIWEISEAATAKDENGRYKINGQKTMIPFIYKSTDNMMIQMLKQKNAGYSNDQGQVLIFNDTTKELLKTIGHYSKLRAFDTFQSVSYPANYLNKGQCIFAIDSTAGATWMGSDAPLVDIPEDKRVEFETVVRAIPQFDTENPKMISQGPSICVFNKKDPQEVVASWLFAQFMLTNKVQIGYAQTEGYLPVTTKATSTQEYQTYLQNAGIDNDKHYAIKLDATKLLLNNIENTFVTPVFAGSVNLRDAAGQLVEECKLAPRQGKTLSDAYLEDLFREVSSQKGLDKMQPKSGPLPTESIIFLVSLAVIWMLLGIYWIRGHVKKKKIPE